MNKNIMRGVVLVALTGGLAALGATAASAIDLDSDGTVDVDGQIVLDGTDVLGDIDLLDGTNGEVDADAPVTVDGLTVSVLGHSGNGPLLGDGVFASTGNSTLDLFSRAGIDSADLIGENETQNAAVSAPVDLSKAWVSAFGKAGNGVIIVPDSTVDGSAATDGVVDGDVVAPVTIDCVTVTVLSDYERDCAAGSGEPTDPTTPTEPTDPATPVEPTDPTFPEEPAAPVVPGDGNDGAAGNGGNGGAVEGDACVTGAALDAANTNADIEAGLVGGGAVAGGLLAVGLIALGRKFSIL